MAEIRVTYDRDSRAAYIYLAAGPVVRTREVVDNRVWADFDAHGSVVGFEAIEIDAVDFPGLLEAMQETLNSGAAGLGAKGERLLHIA